QETALRRLVEVELAKADLLTGAVCARFIGALQASNIGSIEVGSVCLKVIFHTPSCDSVAQCGDCSLVSHVALDLLMRHAVPLQPAVGVLGRVELVRSAEAV